MNISYNWLKEYVNFDLTPDEVAEALTSIGLETGGVEEVQTIKGGLEGIVIGEVLTCEPHPNSDHMHVTTVNLGQGEPVQIVCGAANVAAGQKVVVATLGTKLYDGEECFTIKKSKLRGVESMGMICAEDEIGIGTSHEGIIVLPADAVPGTPAKDYFNIKSEYVLEVDITPNRADACSHYGVARDLYAYLIQNGKQATLKRPSVEAFKVDNHDLDIAVEVENTEACPRYAGVSIKGVTVKESPEWLQNKLRLIGVRPINNIVDITNYVMEEYGQPMHAYDLDTIEYNEIVVRRAARDEKFVTLDGQERTLDESVLVICDGKKAVGIAGIMGGENSMITDNVKTMLFEAACFDGTNIRLSSKKVGLRTDASSKFEKGLDPNNAMEAMNRACQLIEELGAGEVVGGAVDVYPVKKEGRRIAFEPEKYNKLLGTDISRETMLSYFAKLELGYDENTNEVLIPSWRQDLECDADLAEEVARFFGYDKIPTTLPSGEATTGKLTFKLRIEEVARDIAEFCGFSQGMTYSFESPKVFDKLLIPADSPLRNTVVISNPLGEDFSIMRTVSLNGMLTSLATNFNRRNKDVRLYELGNIYLPKQVPVTELPEERMQFTLGMYGEGDFYTMKGVVEEFLYKVGMKLKPEYDPNAGKPYLHPGRQANVVYDGTVIGYLGEVHPLVASNYSIKERVYVAVIDMPEIVARASFDYKYEGIAKFPAATRDISMIVPKSVLAGDIEKIFDNKGGKLLESYQLFDIYEGAQIKAGCKSIAYSLTFRAKDRNLEEADITGAMNKIVKALEGMGAELRK